MNSTLFVIAVLTLASPLSAERVETDVSAPIERALLRTAGVQQVHSMSGPGRSYVEVRIDAGSAGAAVTAVRASLRSGALRLPAGTANHEVFVPAPPLLLP